MKYTTKTILIWSSFLLLFSVFIYSYLCTSLWDYDFWWHVATGRYIVQHRALPKADPFCFTSDLPENRNLHPIREAFILKQYWLAQVIFYLIHENLGDKGIILFRGAIVLAVIFLVFYALHKRNVKFYVSFIFTFLVYKVIGGFSGERPVLFTILFSVVAFLLLDDYKNNKDWRKLLFLVPVMMLWSNLHGGFVLGDVLIVVFMAGETVNMIRHSSYTRRELQRFLLIAAAAIAASFVNPDGITAFSIAFSKKYDFFTGPVQEYQPPFFLYVRKLVPVQYEYVAMVLMFPFILLLKRKKIDITYLMVLAGLFYEGLSSMRFTVYYATVGMIILGREISDVVEKIFDDHLPKKRLAALEYVFAVVLLLSSVFYSVGFLKFEKPGFREAKLFSVPVGGADFIQKNGIRGRIFNDIGSGGYLSWRLYPDNKTFIDTRAINAVPMQEYSFISAAYYSLKSREKPEGVPGNKSELWDRLLDHYDVNIIFLTPLEVYGNIPRLIFKLADSDKWVPVYNDVLSIVYVRNTDANRNIIEKFRRKNNEVFDTVILQASIRARNSNNPSYLMSLGKTFRKLGRLEDSLKAYKYAFEDDHDPAAKEEMQQIEAEIKEKSKTDRKNVR